MGGSSLIGRNRRWPRRFPPGIHGQRVALGVDHAGAQLVVCEQPSAAVRADTELFLELQRRDAVGLRVAIRLGGPERQTVSGSLLACQPSSRPSPRTSAGGSRRTRRCAFLRSAHEAFHGRTREQHRSRPSTAQDFDQPGGAERHRPGTCAGRRGSLSGTCFMWWLRRQERIPNILPSSPALDLDLNIWWQTLATGTMLR